MEEKRFSQWENAVMFDIFCFMSRMKCIWTSALFGSKKCQI